MTRSAVFTAVAVVILGGLVLAYLSLRSTQPPMGDTETASRTSGTEKASQRGDTGKMGDGMAGMGTQEGVPRVPPVKGYAEGQEISFIHTEASAPDIANMLTDMMGSPVLVVPGLARVPEESLANVYVFANGVKVEGPRGPLGFQPDVFDAPPGTEGYSPLRALNKVSWEDKSSARVLKAAAEVKEAEEKGEVKIERPDVVVNMPFLTWPGGRRPARCGHWRRKPEWSPRS